MLLILYYKFFVPLSIAYSTLGFTHYNCNIDNLLVYNINNNDIFEKYLQFKLPIGDVYIKSKYIVLFTGLEKSHINIRNFKLNPSKIEL